ncbi:hypothetical protein [Ekhidna sp.]
MRRGIFLIIVMLVGGCIAVKKIDASENLKSLKISFKDCGEDLSYDYIKLDVPKNYDLTKVRDDYGFCEYQFNYQDNSTLYVSSNSYSGSKLNYKNRLRIGVESYSKNRTKYDSIVNGGIQQNEKFWKEAIYGRYTIGYVDIIKPEAFEMAMRSVKIIND